MKEILLSQGKKALIDDDDFERVSKFKWHASNNKHGRTLSYAVCGTVNKNGSSVRLGRFLLNAKKEEEVLYKNNNTLDNRKENLFLKIKKGHIRIGIKNKQLKNLFSKTRSGYHARIYLGCYATIEEAKKKWEEAIKKLGMNN
jgi:hypothetical protein